jgi:hypothetical protein
VLVAICVVARRTGTSRLRRGSREMEARRR